jgi:Trk K+ transport system NAD-binding subunit
MPATGHVVVCGVDHLGVRTVDELRLRGESVIVVAASAERAADMGIHDARVVEGDHRLARVLAEAGVAAASAIVLTDNSDLGNLTAALAAQELNPGIRIVIRLFDAELGTHLQELFPSAVALSSSALAAPGFVTAALDGETGDQFELGGNVLTALPAATAIAGAARSPDTVPIARLRPDRTVEVLPGASDDPEGLIVLRIEDAAAAAARGAADDASRAAATAARNASRRPAPLERVAGIPAAVRARLAAPERRLVKFVLILVGLAAVSALYFGLTAGLSPLDAVSYAITLLTGASLLATVDAATASAALKIYAIFLSLVGAALVAVVYAFITDAIVRSRLLQTLGRRSIPSNIHDHVIVCGLGAIGYRVATGIAARGVPVVVIETDEAGRFVAPARAAGLPVVIGDARHRELLTDLGLKRARALVAATSDDLVNLAAALNARSVRPDLRVVVRLFDPDFAVRVQHGFGIRFTRSVSHLAAPAFAAAAIGSEVIATIPVGDRRVVIVARAEVVEGSGLDGRTVGSIDEAGARHVIAIERADSQKTAWLPEPERPLVAGDQVVVAATRAGLASLLELGRMRAEPRAVAAGKVVRRGLAAGFARVIRLTALDRIGAFLGPPRG